MSEEAILVLDDDEPFRARLVRALRDRGLEVVETATLAECFEAVEAGGFDRAVIDLRLTTGSGLDAVAAIHTARPATSIVVLTGYGSIATALDAVRLGANHYLTKPAAVDEILAAFDRKADQAERSPQPVAEVPSLARVEWEHINRVLSDCDGNISEAARRLGMHRRSLQRKLAKFPVNR